MFAFAENGVNQHHHLQADNLRFVRF